VSNLVALALVIAGAIALTFVIVGAMTAGAALPG